MKNEIDSFRVFLANRFRPCVYCYSHENLRKEIPDFQNLILANIEKVVNKTQVNPRIIFMDSFPSIKDLRVEDIDLRHIYPGSVPYSFLQEDPYGFKRGEYASLALLRQCLFRNSFCTQYSFFDLPICILYVSGSTDNTKISNPLFNDWSIPYLSNIKAFLLKLPSNDIEASLRKLYEMWIIPKFGEYISRVEAKYIKNWTGWRHTFTDFFHTAEQPSDALLALKEYADLCLCRRMYNESTSAYQLLIDNSNTDYNVLLSQAHLLLAISDILIGRISENTVKSLSASMRIAKNPIQFLLSASTDIWVKYRLSISPLDTLQVFLSTESNHPAIHISRPFFLEQMASISTERKACLIFVNASDAFQQIEAREQSIRCLWYAWGLSRNTGWSLISQQLIEQITQTMMNLHVDISKYLCTSLCYRNLWHPELVYQLLRVNPPMNVFKGGIVDTRLISIDVPGFPSTKPIEFKGDWFMMGEQLFGSYFRGSFFNSNTFFMRPICAIGYPITINFYINSNVEEYPLENVEITMEGLAEIEPIKQINSYPYHGKIEITPQSPGDVLFTGISYKWAGLVNLETIFSDSLYHLLKIYENAPLIRIDVINEPKLQLFIGEITILEIRVKNAGISNLKKLSILIESKEIPYKIIYPSLDEICGQSHLPPLKAGEEITVRIAIHGNTVTCGDFLILIPYWSFDPPPRYSYIHYNLSVVPLDNVSLHIEPSSIAVNGPPGFKALGFSSKSANPNHHTLFCDERKCIFDLVTMKNINHNFIPPAFCESFSNSQFSAFFTDGLSFLEIPLPLLSSKIGILISKITDTLYQMEIRNIGTTKLSDIRISVVSKSDDFSYIISGLSLKIINDLDIMECKSFSFHFIPIESNCFPQVLVVCDQFPVLLDLHIV